MQMTNVILLLVGVVSVAVQQMTASGRAEISTRRDERAREATCGAEPGSHS
jgi:hypothetical protein